MLPPQYGHCGLHHGDIDSRAKNISSGHDPLRVRSGKSYWHKGKCSIPNKQDSDLNVACHQIGALLWDAGGEEFRYMYIFGAGLAGKLITLIFLVARLEMFKVTAVISLEKH